MAWLVECYQPLHREWRRSVHSPESVDATLEDIARDMVFLDQRKDPVAFDLAVACIAADLHKGTCTVNDFDYRAWKVEEK